MTKQYNAIQLYYRILQYNVPKNSDEEVIMAQSTLSIRIDSDDKKEFEEFCDEAGLNVSVAINMYVKNVIRKRKLPFEVEADPFYNKQNMNRLANAVADAKAGKNMTEHELIEVD